MGGRGLNGKTRVDDTRTETAAARGRVRNRPEGRARAATHPSAEAGSLIVRADVADRESLIEDAPETYYVTDYYRQHPVVLARLSQLDADALRDLLLVSWRLTAGKMRRRVRAHRG